VSLSKAWLLAALAAACASAPATLGSGGPDGGSCNGAEQAVETALDGHQTCTADSDCVLVQLPTCVGTLGFGGFVAVTNGAEGETDHAFSVVQAESCPGCPGGTSVAPGGPLVGTGTPTALCIGGSCTSVPGPGVDAGGGSGAFEWACGDGCTSGEYCDVMDSPNAVIFCAPGTYVVRGPGLCLPSAASVGSCDIGGDCGQGRSCDAGACVQGCTTYQPSVCPAGCQLAPDGQGCFICSCPTCPDAGV
jgi:hypothetical protein